MDTSKKVTVAASICVGSYFVYSLLKRHCLSKCVFIANNNEGAAHDRDAITKGFQFTPSDVLDFWFGRIRKNYDTIDATKRKKWFNGGPKFDALIRARFGDFMQSVLEDRAFDDWKATPKGLLALILIADQFTRNAFRGSPRMFKYDAFALALCKFGISKGFDVALFRAHPDFMTFFLMPLSHSEDISDQKLAMQKCAECLANLSQKHPSYSFLIEEQAQLKRHMEVIRECGRFPQRNQILGRETTEKERVIIEKYDLMRLAVWSDSSTARD